MVSRALDARCFQEGCLWSEHVKELTGVTRVDPKVQERLRIYNDRVRQGLRADARILNPDLVTDDQLPRFLA